MKAIDTNVLVRFLVGDDPAQSRKAKRLFQEAESRGHQILITIPVVLETIWVLEACFDCPGPAVLDALEQLTLTPALQFEAPQRITTLIIHGRQTSLDLADVLIGLTAQELGCETVLTFDKKAARYDLFQAL